MIDNLVDFNDSFDKQVETFLACMNENIHQRLVKSEIGISAYERYLAVAYSVVDHMIERWIKTQVTYTKAKPKRVFYISMEFLMGRTLSNSLICLGLYDVAKEALNQMGYNLDDLMEEEVDAGLGNGGLGRLAACFLDSMANLGIPAHGYGLRYEYGMFNQHIVDGKQIEKPDNWLSLPYPWEANRYRHQYQVYFGGSVNRLDSNEIHPSIWEHTEDVIAVAADTPIAGYKEENVNVLRLWSAQATEEFNLDYFSGGDYVAACENQVKTENITKVLYPNDNVFEGKELRLKQEYLLVSASIQDIVSRFMIEHGVEKFNEFSDYVAIQLNDTHPALAIAELMRIFVDYHNVPWEKAWEIVTKTFAYTNHTLLPEALEEWPVSLIERLLPRHMEIIYQINYFFMREVSLKYPGDVERMKRMSIIAEEVTKRVKMASLAVVGSHKVNGVAKLHSDLVKSILFKDFYELTPEKFINITNGVTPRRWIMSANPTLTNLINSAIGDSWTKDFTKLAELEKFTEDASFVEEWRKVKTANKQSFSLFLPKDCGLIVDPHSMFDVQVKRIHEYKRQLLLVIFAISRYMYIKNNCNAEVAPRTIMIGGKAAPGYWKAKQIIYFINKVAEIINQDPDMKGKLKLLFLPNYRVSLAEHIMPASELSEQISTAGYEASGTGNMKLTLNGSLTIGTLDGANVEIRDAVGEENIFIFGKTAQEVIDLKKNYYSPKEYITNSPVLQSIIRLIKVDFFSQGDPGAFKFIADELLNEDRYMLMADFDMYLKKQVEVDLLYKDQIEWNKKSIINVARASNFSSDRCIEEYNNNIWHAKSVRMQN